MLLFFFTIFLTNYRLFDFIFFTVYIDLTFLLILFSLQYFIQQVFHSYEPVFIFTIIFGLLYLAVAFFDI